MGAAFGAVARLHWPSGREDGERPLRASKHERRIDAHHAIAQPAQLLVAPTVRRAPDAMQGAVHLHDEPHSRRKEVRDVAFA